MIFYADFRSKDVSGAVVPGRIVGALGSAATEEELRRAHDVVFLIHGFNVNRHDGWTQLREFANRLEEPERDVAFVVVTWPGDSWIGAASYPLEGNNADDSAKELARFIDRVLPNGTPVKFISHSLGGRVVFETIKRLTAGRYPVPQVCVMAPAVDDYSVSASKSYRAPVERAVRVAVLASEADRVLQLAYPLGDFFQSFAFFWKDTLGLALGYHGPRPAGPEPVPANVSHVQIAKSVGSGHGDYLSAGAPNPRQARANAFAGKVIRGDSNPAY